MGSPRAVGVQRNGRAGSPRQHRPVIRIIPDGRGASPPPGTMHRETAPMPTRTPAVEPFLGLLRLQTRFPRLPGDAGEPASWPMPVRLAVVAGASPQRVVRQADA